MSVKISSFEVPMTANPKQWIDPANTVQYNINDHRMWITRRYIPEQQSGENIVFVLRSRILRIVHCRRTIFYIFGFCYFHCTFWCYVILNRGRSTASDVKEHQLSKEFDSISAHCDIQQRDYSSVTDKQLTSTVHRIYTLATWKPYISKA